MAQQKGVNCNFGKKGKIKSDEFDEVDSTTQSKIQLKKSRREVVEESILNKFHLSQNLQSIIHPNRVKDVFDDCFEKEAKDDEPTSTTLSDFDLKEVDKLLRDTDVIFTERRKKLSKDKKKFKEQQRQKKQKDQPPEVSEEHKAITYLRQWRKNRNEWKFNKNKHIWLLKNWKNSNKISDKKFKTFVKYIQSMQCKSLALQRLEAEAQSIVDSKLPQQQPTTSSSEVSTSVVEKDSSITESKSNEELTENSDQTEYKRARIILQCIV